MAFLVLPMIELALLFARIVTREPRGGEADLQRTEHTWWRKEGCRDGADSALAVLHVRNALSFVCNGLKKTWKRGTGKEATV